jgi:hypothetical protein
VLVAAAHGYAGSAETSVEVDQPGQVAEANFSLRIGGRLYGRVVDAQTHQPIAQAQVALEGAIGPDDSPLAVSRSTSSQSDGSFSLSGLGPGLQSVVASAPGHHSRILSQLQIEDGDLGPLTIELSATADGEQPRTELVGIGAVLQPQGEALRIAQVLSGGGADEAGLSAGDLIVAIDGRAVTELGFSGAIQRIRGQEGTSVRLTMQRGGTASDVVAYRRKVRS